MFLNLVKTLVLHAILPVKINDSSQWLVCGLMSKATLEGDIETSEMEAQTCLYQRDSPWEFPY